MRKSDKVYKILGDEEVPSYIDLKLKESKDILKKEARRKKMVKSLSMSAAATCVIVAGISLTNPSLAAKIPFIGNVMNNLTEDKPFAEKMNIVKSIKNEDAKSIKEKVVDKGIGVTVQEAYCDGSNIFISYIIEVEDGDLNEYDIININDVVNYREIRASFSDEMLQTSDYAFKKVDDSTYAGVVYIDLATYINEGVEIPDEFELETNIHKISSRQIPGDKSKVVEGSWRHKFTIEKNDSKNIKYEPNLESNGAILKKLIITPGTTEVEVDIPKEFGDSAYVLVYDDKGKRVQDHTCSYNLDSDIGTLAYRKYEPISDDSEYAVVHIVDKATQELKILAEFKVPLK
ncbi:DUF4179 domain-containing protein [Romboutsia weinsteinii]|uniref:DUF4179 domain-containing protein n=1 Tax=Romboutsia weinsteinii TaxID=2020949 RepID=A0A371J324_9FIRM|nr:DUF4179 domain-containing protein [Romboutsia weinsteinii]RDY27077.1 DUF4179 domain-containing protein [Romboutsia weinsteinii]